MIFLFPFGGGSTTTGTAADRWIVVPITGSATFALYTPADSTVTWVSFTTLG